ncbi:Thioredoxin reductase [Pseudonocardia thermophila]|uniref:Thioredoxin reductase n=1 Tax=Pseudonocardia thermophila TaxID=1848 RepID=A0A1M6U471_PSETH|nr:NAD(P)/FAD-dependent oxidoreductase [Pseudonocardia thermophila]SHK64072.1 Thioredoxin reductase [Pseudonocardia thermophila]
MRDESVDVVVIGGGIAGLSGALTLVRARRSVLVLDSGEPRGAPAAAVHGLLSRDGVPPAELLAEARCETERCGGRVVLDPAVAARRCGAGFVVTTAAGRSVGARRLLVTTGLVDELPAVPGLRERWGRDVLHCPYCHGWEVRDRRIGVLGCAAGAVEQALLFRQWSPRIVLFLHTAPEPSDEEWEQLAARRIQVVDGEVAGLVVDPAVDRVTAVRLVSGPEVAVDALAVRPRFVARAGLLAALGLSVVEDATGVRVPADPTGATAVPGVWVAGNVTDLTANAVVSAAAGTTAAARINHDLVLADTAAAVAAREDFSAAAEAALCERVLGDRRHGLTPA